MKFRIQPHLRVGEGDVEKVVIITGNPDRVPLIASQMKKGEEVARNRGLVTYRAYTPGGVAVTISGTGMGTPSTHICLEELAKLGAQSIIRIGTCGGIDLSVKTGDVVVPIGSIRDERTSMNYAPIQYPAVASADLHRALLDEMSALFPPDRVHSGVCWTTDVYYATPENNQLDLWTRCNVKCVEMESSLLFVFAQTRGLRAASILAVDGNLHGDQKQEQRDNTQKTGEQSPLLIDAIEKETRATIRAIDRIFKGRTT